MTIHEIVTICPPVAILLREAYGYRTTKLRYEGYRKLKAQISMYIGVEAVFPTDENLRTTAAFDIVIRELCDRLKI